MNNTISVIGYVGQNPHTISFGDTGNKVVKFSVAVKEFSANSEVTNTLWLHVDAWNGLLDRVLKIITKGREVLVHGRLALSIFNRCFFDFHLLEEGWLSTPPYNEGSAKAEPFSRLHN